VLQLYHHGSSVCAAKVRLALFEKGVPWDGHYIDILAGEQFQSDFLALSPNGLVPVVVHDGHVIRESTVINEYVDEEFAGPALRPADPVGRARMRIWTKLVDEVLHPAVGPITFAVSHRYTVLDLPPDRREAYINATPDPVQRQRKRLWIEKGFEAPDFRDAMRNYLRAIQLMEQALENQAWLAGTDYSLADIALTPYVTRLDMLGIWAMCQGDLPHTAAWFDRIRARASFEDALHRYLPESLRQSMLANGTRAAPELEAFLASADRTSSQPAGGSCEIALREP
jgi:glutathione S-transferase